MDFALTPLAKNLRKNSTFAERLLWRCLRSKQLHGLKFRRQELIGSYIVDFVCFAKKIVVELDGGHHVQEENRARDDKRDMWLKNQGFSILRFGNNDIMQNIEGVGEKIIRHCSDTLPQPLPSREGE